MDEMTWTTSLSVSGGDCSAVMPAVARTAVSASVTCSAYARDGQTRCRSVSTHMQTCNQSGADVRVYHAHLSVPRQHRRLEVSTVMTSWG